MQKIIYLSLFSFLLFSCSGVKKDDQKEVKNTKDYSGLLSKVQKIFSTPPDVAKTSAYEITPELVSLGKKLFYDTRLSADNSISCNSCHNISTFGVDNKPVSDGINGQKGKRNSPTVFNAAFHTAQFWDGRAKDVEEQAGMPILNPEEMGIKSEKELESKLAATSDYPQVFNAAYGDEEISFDRIKQAIAAFERTLVTNNSRFDKYLRGTEFAITNDEKEGVSLFIDYGCTTCHAGDLQGGTMFQKFGVFDRYWKFAGGDSTDQGKMAVTQNEADLHVFKVPSLRNISKTGPYLHDGSVADLEKVVILMGKAQLDKDISPEEAKYIAAFLKSLDGKVKDEWLEE